MTIRPVGKKFPKPWRKSDEYFTKYADFFPLPTDYRRAAGGEAADLCSVSQFNFLTMLGLREHHYVLDIGCGSLRAGRLLIPYLLPGRYYGIDPMEWMIEAGIENEVGEDLVRVKRPTFSNDDQLDLSALGQTFDFLLAHSVLPHLSRPMIEKCILEAAKVMRGKDSMFVATYVEAQVDCDDNEWGMTHAAHYRWETIQGMAKENGLVGLVTNWPHVGQQWIIFVFPKFRKEVLHRIFDPVSHLGRMLKGKRKTQGVVVEKLL